MYQHSFEWKQRKVSRGEERVRIILSPIDDARGKQQRDGEGGEGGGMWAAVCLFVTDTRPNASLLARVCGSRNMKYPNAWGRRQNIRGSHMAKKDTRRAPPPFVVAVFEYIVGHPETCPTSPSRICAG